MYRALKTDLHFAAQHATNSPVANFFADCLVCDMMSQLITNKLKRAISLHVVVEFDILCRLIDPPVLMYRDNDGGPIA